MMEDENSEDVVYEDEVLEILSLGDENEQDRIEDIDEDMIDLQLVGDPNGDLATEEDIEDMAITTFTPLRDDSIAKFTWHKGPVFTVSCDHTSLLICSGDQEDRGVVWKLLETGPEVVFECTGHKDSVTCSGFSHDGKYVSTSDLSGLIQVWEVLPAPAYGGKLVWQFETSSIEWLCWHHQANVVFCGTSDGEVWFWRIPSGECKTICSSGCGCTAGALLPDGKRLCCGYVDGSVKIWDLKSTALICALTNQNSSVTCLSCHGDGNRVLVGYTNGQTLLVSTNDLKVLASFASLQDSSKSGDDDTSVSVESVAFTPLLSSHHLALVATVTGQLIMWDLPTQKIRHSIQTEGIVKMVVSGGKGECVYTCHLDGVIRQWSIVTGACMEAWHGHSAGILDMALTSGESRILTSSDDCSVCIYSNSKKT